MTNKRKRAPGGGRKPQGPFSNKLATLSTRITAELRQRLDQETEHRRKARGASPWSLSQEIETRLRESLDLPAELQVAWGPPHIKALAQLVSRVTRSIEAGAGADPLTNEAGELAWHRSPFTHAALVSAVAAILAHYKPAGEIQTPPELKRSTEWIEREAGEREAGRQRTPENFGMSCARGLLGQLAFQQAPPLNHSANARYGESHYVLPHIRDILKEPKK
jgi:hypothetical protein